MIGHETSCATENEKDEKLKLRKITVASVALAAALTMSACSSDDDSTTVEETTATSATVEVQETEVESDYPPVPTAEELNAELARAFDTSVPVEEKTDLVQGSEQDPELINRVAEAAAVNGIQVTVIDVTDLGNGVLTASVEMAVEGSPEPNFGTVDFVAEDDRWKVSQDYACSIVSLAQLQSPACI